MNILVIGGGVSGMVAAINIKNKHPKYNVILAEKNNVLGGRLYQEKQDEYILNNGPSWYWMADIIDSVLIEIGITNSIKTLKLDPQYKIVFKNQSIDIPSNCNDFRKLIMSLDPSCIENFDKFMEHNKYKYELCKNKYLKFKNLSIFEYFSIFTPYYIYKLDLLRTYRNIINSISTNEIVRQILEWPCLFIGSHPEKISGLFTFLTYSMINDGTHIPIKNGMIDLINILENKLQDLNVNILKEHNLIDYKFNNNNIKEAIFINNNEKVNIKADKVIATCDYYFNEKLLPNKFQSYSNRFWEKQILCPSCIIFNIVLDTKLPQLEYHNLFFDGNLDEHLDLIYNSNDLPRDPLFYVNITSKLFNEVPFYCENLFILIPSNLKTPLSHRKQEKLYKNIIDRLSKYCNTDIENHIKKVSCFKNQDFYKRFNSYGNNAYGLGCDRFQIAFNRPKTKSKYINNLYYAGQMTCPGPGIPPCMISGLNVSNLLLNDNVWNTWNILKNILNPILQIFF